MTDLEALFDQTRQLLKETRDEADANGFDDVVQKLHKILILLEEAAAYADSNERFLDADEA